MKTKIKSLDALRGAACLIVVSMHWLSTGSTNGIYASGCGKIGVWCFMLLTGYFLMLPILDGSGRFSCKKYYIKKAARIYPVYITALFTAVWCGLLETGSIVPHLFAMEGFYHFWYMPVVIKMYLVWPAFVYVYKKTGSRRNYAVLLGIFGMFCAFMWPYTEYNENSTRLFWYLPVFILGMLLALLVKSGGRKPVWDMAGLLGALGIILLTPWARERFWGIAPSGWLQNKYLLVGGLWSLIIGAALSGAWGEVLDKCRVLQWIGNLSFPIYLFHFTILLKLNNYYPNMWEKGGLMLLIVFPISVAAHYFIEKPVQSAFICNGR